MPQTYGYIRTGRQHQEGTPCMDPASQELQFRRAGVPPGNIFRDVGISGSTGTRERRGWHQLSDRLAGGDTLVVVAIGRLWTDTVRSMVELRGRGVRIRSLAETEAQWTRYLEADESSPEAFFGGDILDTLGSEALVALSEDLNSGPCRIPSLYDGWLLAKCLTKLGRELSNPEKTNLPTTGWD